MVPPFLRLPDAIHQPNLGLESTKRTMGHSLWRIKVRSGMKFPDFRMEHAREPAELFWFRMPPGRVEDARKRAKGFTGLRGYHAVQSRETCE